MVNAHANIETLLVSIVSRHTARAKILPLRMYYARINIRNRTLSNAYGLVRGVRAGPFRPFGTVSNRLYPKSSIS
ncbi:MAG: hypothetical protein QOJ39_1495 [Candidatus Eremiobacteraeota bacterium]|jgi:hypothetical protein|nr:hypothetical protein [Candidatus Eremiobacteraeota bacterium]